jgi:hypothetical protein
MSRYGIDYYGLSSYGSSAAVNYLAGSFTAQSRGYGFIRVKWTSPSGKWSTVRLVRNSYGFPVNAYDGDILVSVPKENDPTLYNDNTNLARGVFYYYSLFVYDTISFNWIRSGNITGVSVKDYKYGDNLYEYLPDIYKIKQPYIATSDWDNEDLSNFMHLFGFQLDYAQTVTTLLVERYNLEKVAGTLLPSMLQQFGLVYEPEIGYQQSRILVRDAVQIGKKKGSAQGLREFMKAFTGYAVPEPIAGTPNPSADGLTMGHNLMLDYNDSSFEESVGHWGSSSSNAALAPLTIKDITRVSLTTNVARLIIGTHAYQVGNKINTQGFSQPLFNTVGSAKTITAIDATSVSFALTAGDVAEINAYNSGTLSYPKLIPFPTPWEETTALVLYPNKQNGILSVKNSTASAATLLLECGIDSPVLEGIPVIAGSSYTFSVYSAAGTTVRGIVLKLRWYGRLGEFISESSGSSVNNTVGEFSARPTVSATAASGAYYVVPAITVVSAAASSSNEYHYFDCAQFEQSASVTDFDEARQVHMVLRATRINELLNPHFASPLTPWAVTGATTAVNTATKEPDVEVFSVSYRSLSSNIATLETNVSHDFRTGDSIVVEGVGAPFDGVFTVATVGVNIVDEDQESKTLTYALTSTNVTRNTTELTDAEIYISGDALDITATGTSVLIKSTTTTADLMGIHYPSTSYTFSVYIQVPSGTEPIVPAIVWYDSSKAVISTSTGSSFTVDGTGTVWDRVFITDTAPENAAYAHVQLSWTATIGDVIRLDSALFENTSAISPFFTGSYGPANNTDLFWENGAANAGRSHLYKNRFAIQTRLSDYALENQVNLGTTVAIYLAQPQT